MRVNRNTAAYEALEICRRFFPWRILGYRMKDFPDLGTLRGYGAKRHAELTGNYAELKRLRDAENKVGN